jgi:hypothetical protein
MEVLMVRHDGSCGWTVVAFLVLAPVVLPVLPASAQTRHHISFGPGYSKMLSDDLKNEALGVDLTDSGNGSVGYRFSMNPHFDLTIDAYGLMSKDTYQGQDLTLQSSFLGPGVRWVASQATPRPFLQVNAFFVDEEVDLEQNGVKVSHHATKGGFGVMAGVDPRLTPLLSLPVSMHYLYGKPEDDVSGLGFNVSLAFNWGSMP